MDNNARLLIADRDLLIARARIRELEAALVTAKADGRAEALAERDKEWQSVLVDIERRVRKECCGED